MVCVLHAAQDAGLPFRAVALKALGDGGDVTGLDLTTFIVDAGKPDFRDDTKALFAASSGPVYSFIGGIMHVQLGLRRLDDPSEPPFDFVLPDAPDAPLDASAEIIPSDAMREIVRHQFKMRLKMMGRLAQMAPGRVVQFAPPPPVSDIWLQWLLNKSWMKATEAPNRWVRWKLWRLTVEIFRQQAVSVGARFVESPIESLDGEGFMRDELVKNATHGNNAFGALLLQQIRSLS